MANVPVRKIFRPERGKDGLFVQPTDVSAGREQIENKLRAAAAEHFNYADPYTGNTRTYDEKGRYNCGRCNQVHGTQCLLVDLPAVSLEAGSCRKWENVCAGDPEVLYRYGDDEEAVYGVAENGVGFGCARCPFSSKAVQPDSRGRTLYCGKLWFRVFKDACCSLNAVKTLPDNDGDDEDEDEGYKGAKSAMDEAIAGLDSDEDDE